MLTEAVIDGTLRSEIAERLPRQRIVDAHERVAAGATGRVILQVA